MIHHFPGWDEWTAEVVRKFADHGYATIAPSLYFRLGDGASPEVVARARTAGGMPDDQVMGDVSGAASFLRAQPNSNGKVGVIGFCSGGRQAYLAACRIADLDAVVDCWGGSVVVDDPSKLPKHSAGRTYRVDRRESAALFWEYSVTDDTNPSPADVDRTEAALKRFGKNYEFHRYDQAGHAFFAWYRPNYRPEQAQEGWKKVFAFFKNSLAASSDRAASAVRRTRRDLRPWL